MNLIILGAPGSGKGTQAKLIADHFSLSHVSSGELLRNEANSGTAKGKLIADLQANGQLLPFETVLDVIEPAFISHPDGFILDGTPRNLNQAEALDYFFSEKKITLHKVIYLDIPTEEGISRILKRSQVEHRADDNYETVKERMQIYESETKPVIDFYQAKGILLKIDGTPDIDTIFKDIVNRLTLA